MIFGWVSARQPPSSLPTGMQLPFVWAISDTQVTLIHNRHSFASRFSFGLILVEDAITSIRESSRSRWSVGCHDFSTEISPFSAARQA